MSYRVRIQNPKSIDVRRIHDAIRALGYNHQDAHAADFLSTLSIEGRTFRFVVNDRGFDRLRVLCPTCGVRRQVLVVVEGDARCRSCHNLAEPSRCQTQHSDVIYARYLRPWLLRAVLESKLIGATGRRRAILLNKIAKLKRVSPYAAMLFDDGVVPLEQIKPSYFDALARVL